MKLTIFGGSFIDFYFFLSCFSCALNIAIWIFCVLAIAFLVIAAGVYFKVFNIDKQSPELARIVNNTIFPKN